MENWIFLILLVMRNLGLVSAALGKIQNSEGKMEGIQWKKEMPRDSWKERRTKVQEHGTTKSRHEMRKPAKNIQMYPAEWLSVEHRKDIIEEVHRYL